jgi:hypothetical protein
MSNMKYILISILSPLVFFFSCKKNDTKKDNTLQSVTIPINICTSFSLNSNFSICYDSLLFDNRCPDLAMCARRGEVGVKLIFKQNNNTIPFRLADFPNPIGNFPTDTTINRVHIKLVDVLPHPFSNQSTEKKVVIEIN